MIVVPIPEAAKWRREQFNIRVRGEKGPEWRPVVGHTDGTFGLDRRRYLDDETLNFTTGPRSRRRGFGYCVSHLATGYAIRFVRDTLPSAKAFADALHCANWNFTDPEKGKADPRRGVAVKAACAAFRTSDGMGFDPASGIETEGGNEVPSRSDGSPAQKGDAHA